MQALEVARRFRTIYVPVSSFMLVTDEPDVVRAVQDHSQNPAGRDNAALEVQRHVGLIPQHPAVVSGWDVEHVAGLHFYVGAVVHRDHGTTRQHHADMLDLAALFANRRTDVLGPLPAWRITGSSHGHTARREEQPKGGRSAGDSLDEGGLPDR